MNNDQASNEKRDKDLRGIVNASGFTFQLAIEKLIKPGRYPWEISREHHWSDPESNTEGFSDLIVDSPIITLIIECKRALYAKWAFLVPEGEHLLAEGAKCLWVGTAHDQRPVYGIEKFVFSPPSCRSSFCMVRGQGEGQSSILERLGSELVRATNGIAFQWANDVLHRGISNGHFFIPMIVTTAHLFKCRFDPEETSIEDGKLPKETQFEPVPFIRFSKSFSGSHREKAESLLDLSRLNEQTILVVSASEFSNFLSQFVYPYPIEGYVWNKERSTIIERE